MRSYTMQTYGFKNWQELNDEARQELEESLSTQIHQELDIQFYRINNDWIGDLVDAYNMPLDEAEDLIAANLSVWFEQHEYLADPETDISDLVEMHLNDLEDEFDVDDLMEEVSRRREARDRGK